MRRLIENILAFNLNLIIKIKNRIRKSLGEIEKIFDYNYIGLKLDVWRKYYVVK
ncbi:phenylacetate--CoA ligase [Clostridium botulinum A2B7 92]|nr:phenylacetate--CoA ligase [Clostridium botulinum A2B7 92]